MPCAGQKLQNQNFAELAGVLGHHTGGCLTCNADTRSRTHAAAQCGQSSAQQCPR